MTNSSNSSNTANLSPCPVCGNAGGATGLGGESGYEGPCHGTEPIVLVCSTPEGLRAALSGHSATATVEAEYGSTVVEGSVATLAHHGARSGQPCPCLYEGQVVTVTAIGLSHVDLDALGGALALQGRRPGPVSFWALAAHVDTAGPHRLEEGRPSAEDRAALHAWWAWSEAHRFAVPRDGSVAEATQWVAEAETALRAIFRGDPELSSAGAAMAAREAELERASFRRRELARGGQVFVREADRFTNHLYSHIEAGTGDVWTAAAVVAINTATGAVTLSWESPQFAAAHPAVELVQALWGNLAGGHAGIAGSPRGERFELRDAFALAVLVREVLSGYSLGTATALARRYRELQG